MIQPSHLIRNFTLQFKHRIACNSIIFSRKVLNFWITFQIVCENVQITKTSALVSSNILLSVIIMATNYDSYGFYSYSYNSYNYDSYNFKIHISLNFFWRTVFFKKTIRWYSKKKNLELGRIDTTISTKFVFVQDTKVKFGRKFFL